MDKLLITLPCRSREYHQAHRWTAELYNETYACRGVYAPLRCTGRAVDDALRPIGVICGHLFNGSEDQARAAGWRLGPIQADTTRPVMCPSCSRPDPITTAHIRDIEKGRRR